jgi:hypothetical protein
MKMDNEALWGEIEKLRRQLEDIGKTGAGRARFFRGRRAIIFLAGIAAGLVAAQIFFGEARAVAQNDGKDVLVCHTLKLVGSDGKDMLVLGSDADGGFLRMLGQDGKLRAYLAVGAQVGPAFLNLYGTDQKTLLNLGYGADGGSIGVWGKDGKQRVYLGSGVVNNSGQGSGPNSSAGRLSLFGQDGKNLLNLGADADGGYAAIHARDGKERVFLGVAPNVGGGLLNLLDTNGNYKVTLAGK